MVIQLKQQKAAEMENAVKLSLESIEAAEIDNDMDSVDFLEDHRTHKQPKLLTSLSEMSSLSH